MQVQQRGRPMPFTEEQMRQIYNTNIIDFAVRNGFEIEKSDKATVHVKHNGGLYLFKHGRRDCKKSLFYMILFRPISFLFGRKWDEMFVYVPFSI